LVNSIDEERKTRMEDRGLNIAKAGAVSNLYSLSSILVFG